ncbi:hypothetical protein VNO77_21388 [Canavalia gladiata]|uniref:Uncharacterized protein n=1 Tax=Canavalia gladiata TaxID=3824 RepID=A0AAN9LV53_CANGL
MRRPGCNYEMTVTNEKLLRRIGVSNWKNVSQIFGPFLFQAHKFIYPTVIEELCLCHQFSHADLRKSTNNFDENRVIEQGEIGQNDEVADKIKTQKKHIGEDWNEKREMKDVEPFVFYFFIMLEPTPSLGEVRLG